MASILDGIETVPLSLQSLNVSFPIDFRPAGRLIDVIGHLQNAPSPILSNPVGNLIDANDVQALKASLPIEVKPTGKFIDDNEEHALKAPRPIVFTDDGILILYNEQQC